jgi:hypothetical protein
VASPHLESGARRDVPSANAPLISTPPLVFAPSLFEPASSISSDLRASGGDLRFGVINYDVHVPVEIKVFFKSVHN